MRCSVFVAASVDGYIAKRDDDVDWLHRPEYGAPPGLSYDEFIATVDGLVMGRRTFDKVLTFGGWPYRDVDVIVLSSRPVEAPAGLDGKFRTMSGPPERIAATLAAEGKRHLYVDGGATVQRFLEARLIDEITITRVPVILGDGIPLFGRLGAEQRLRLLEAVSSPGGFVQERYEVRR